MGTAAITPKARPQLPGDRVREVVNRILRENPESDSAAIDKACPVKILGVRGYYRNTLGRLGVNDVGVFDDAGFVVSPDKISRFNWNCDPSKIGWNPNIDKYYAQLMPGVWPYREGPHRGKPGALRQFNNEDAGLAGLERFFTDDRADGYFCVRRVEKENVGKLEMRYQAINIHWGGQHGTNSWGCQTIPEPQWDEFHDAIYGALDAHGQQWDPKAKRYGWVPYLLTEEKLA